MRGTILVLALLAQACAPRAESRYLALATDASDWLESVAVEDRGATHWPVAPDRGAAPAASLYSGTPGVILFYLELYKATKDERFREIAEAGARWLAAQPLEGNPGLYTGVAGIGTTFLELYAHLKDEAYRDRARAAADHLAGADRIGGDVTDIIYGSAGIGLFLIRASVALNEPEYLEAARRAGNDLIDTAIREKTGIRWRMSPRAPRTYPNFSHGTSGVAYFLAVLYEHTKQQGYLEAAILGAAWLDANRVATDAGAVWYRHEPDATDLYYVSWCHGPAGTARLFYQLHRVTGEDRWMEWVRESARWILGCGIPDRPHPGFWNVSICCGSAGVGDFFADLTALTGEARYREMAEVMVEDLVKRSTPGEPGLKWIQAENRVSPNDVWAQTGYDQGAAGIGMFFLKMYALESGDEAFKPLRLPDSPFD